MPNEEKKYCDNALPVLIPLLVTGFGLIDGSVFKIHITQPQPRQTLPE
jgi:hypothetical protein